MSQPSLRVYLLGTFKALYRGIPLTIQAPPRVPLLWAYLILHPQEPIQRQRLAFLFWPEEPESVARTNLRRHLHRLRRALPETAIPWLLVNPRTVQWNPESDYWLDVSEYEDLADQEKTWRQAVDSYQGDLMPDSYEDWVIARREELRNEFSRVLNALIEKVRKQRDFPQAIALIERLRLFDPLQENTLRLAMRIHYEAGDRAGALSAFENFSSLLHQELNVAPMPETLALHEAILRNRMDTGNEIPATGVRSPFVSPWPFVGRERAFKQLGQRWQSANTGQVVIITGEPGVGKTRLLQEFTHFANQHGARVLWGRTPPEEDYPFEAIKKVLDDALPLLSALELPPVWLAALSEIVPALKQRLNQLGKRIPTLPALEPQAEQMRLFEAVAQSLQGLARPRPLLLILDDLHHAGDTTLRMIAHLARRLQDTPIQLIVSCCKEEDPHGRRVFDLGRELEREGIPLQVLALTPLGERDVHTWIQLAFDSGESQTTFGSILFLLSEGNPLLLGTLCQGLQKEMKKLSGSSLVPLEALPGIEPRLKHLMESRLQGLSPSALTLVEIAAVSMQGFDVPLTAEITGWEPSQVMEAIDELLDQHLVCENRLRNDYPYSFCHELLRSTLYQRLPPDRKTRYHHRWAHILNRLDQSRKEKVIGQLARHFELGGENEQAARYYLEVCRRQIRLQVDAEAVRLLSHGLELTADHRLRAEFLLLREEAEHRLGKREDQQADLDQLYSLSQTLQEDDLTGLVLKRRIRWAAVVGDRERQMQEIQLLKDHAQLTGKPRWQSASLLAEAVAFQFRGEYSSAQTLLQEALAIFEEIQDLDGQLDCYLAMMNSAVHQWQPEVFQPCLLRMHMLLEEHSDRSKLLKMLNAAGMAAFAKREYALMIELVQQMLEVSQAAGDRESEAEAHSRLGIVNARLFRVKEAREHYEQAAALFAMNGKVQGQAGVSLNHGILLVDLGRFEEAVANFKQAFKGFQTLQDGRGQMVSALNLSAVSIYRRDYVQAEESARQALQMARKLKIPLVEVAAFGNLGEIALNQGNLKQSIEWIQLALDLRSELDLPDISNDLALLAKAYLETGHLEESQKCADQWLQQYHKNASQMAYPQLGLWIASTIFKQVGKKTQARELLSQAYELVQERAAKISEPELRAAFLRFPYNRTVLQAYHERR